MEYSDKIKQLLKHLDKNYYVGDDKFLTKHGDIHEWGLDISSSLTTIFSFDEDFCENTFRHWAYFNGCSSESLGKAWKSNALKAVWTPEMAQDLMAFHNIDVEAELRNVLAAEVGVEIDRDILRQLRGVDNIPEE